MLHGCQKWDVRLQVTLKESQSRSCWLSIYLHRKPGGGGHSLTKHQTTILEGFLLPYSAGCSPPQPPHPACRPMLALYVGLPELTPQSFETTMTFVQADLFIGHNQTQSHWLNLIVFGCWTQLYNIQWLSLIRFDLFGNWNRAYTNFGVRFRSI